MLRSRWLALALLAPVLAACGGDDESSSTPEVRKPPLTVPGEPTAPPTDTESTDTTESPAGESTDGSDSTTGPSAPLDQPNPGNGGVPAPDSNAPQPSQQVPEDSAENDTPPEPGSPQDRFEQFCAQNPGAC